MQLHLYPLKCDIAVFDAAHSSVFVNIAGFDKLVQRSFCLDITIVILTIECRNNTFMGT